jgi:class 3 adenylate cyclase/tetratricopeptide (TPR) repeat protein
VAAAGRLTAYVPRLAAEWLGTDPAAMHRCVEGSLAFVDISGFTVLTERLARIGREGAEELSDILDATFAALLASAGDGDLVKWGGDAILLLFRGEGHAVRAAAAAHRMRAALRSVGAVRTSAGVVRLRMSTGVHSGLFDFFLVGDPAVHRELLVCGPGATVTAQLESIAASGQIAVSDATAALLPSSVLGEPVVGGRLLRRCPPAVAPGLVTSPETVEVAGLLPPLIREHLLDRFGESEHRAVAVAFVRYSGIDGVLRDDGPAAAAAALDECVRRIQHACASFGVSFQESDLDRDGGKFLLVAGAPRASERDEERLLHAAREIAAWSGRLAVRVGVNRGPVFAGDFGPDHRRTFSIKGDAVNVAARVMAHAPDGEVLATDDVLARSQTVFRTRPVPSFAVKGKTEPIRAALVGEPLGERGDGDDLGFVGRTAELETFADAVAGLREGRGGVIDVVAEPGMGKSRLIDEVSSRSGDLDIRRVASNSYDSDSAYRAVALLVRDLLGIGPGGAAAAVEEVLSETVDERTPHLLPWLPLLGTVLDVAIPPTPETRDLDERFRASRLAEVVTEFLGVLLPGAALLVFEDAHLADESSAGVLHRVATETGRRPWLLVTTRRDVASGFVPNERDRRIDLAPISAADRHALLQATPSAAELSPQVLATVAERSGGNPLFLRALLAAAQSGTDIDVPGSVEAVLGAEIDRLSPRDRTVLRYAAVLGMSFSTELLRELDPGAAAELRALHEYLEPDGAGQWRFRHLLIRDVAYAGLPFRQRRRLHQRAGLILETTARPEENADRLALHFFSAGDSARAWRYCRLAAERAHARYAYAPALDFYQRAVESAARVPTIDRAEIAAVLDALGDAADLAGSSQEALSAYRRARTLRREDAVARASLALKEAGLLQRVGSYPTSLRLLSHARGLLSEVPGAQADALRSRLSTRRAFAHYLTAQSRGALRWSEVGVREARASRDDDALAFAFNTRHLACIQAGVVEAEPYGELALAAYDRLGDLRMQGHCLNNLAIGLMQDGRWDDSADRLERAAVLFTRIGDTVNEANTRYNLADLLIRQRRFDEAVPLLGAARRTAAAAGDRELVGLAERELGRALTGAGDPDAAGGHLDAAREVFLDLDLAHELITLDAAVAEREIALGAPEAAIETVSAAIERAHDAAMLLAGLYRVRGDALLAAGDPERAALDYAEGAEHSAAGDGGKERALNILGGAQAARLTGAPIDAIAVADARTVLARLGVRQLASVT